MRKSSGWLGIVFLCASAFAQAPDITKQSVLYVVPYAHLDTQWNWDFVRTINEYLPKTTRTNFDFFEKYPHYVFNFTGANRYRLIREYYPDDYAKMKKYIADGRWYPAGSSIEEGDVNAPNAEAIIRQILYGNDWFRHEFGKASAEYMLPDCFGFPASLPSILAHTGVKGFSTQKLSAAWQPAARVGGPDSPEQTPDGIPFNVGIWKGPDGKSVIAALNPESYTSRVNYDFSKTPAPPPPPPASAPPGRGGQRLTDWVARIKIDGQLTGLFADYHYIGTGDTGGAVDENSVKLLEAIVTKGMGVIPPPGQGGGGRGGQQPPVPPPPPMQVGDGPVHVAPSFADRMFLDILKTGKLDRLPTYQGDLELINHSAGSLTSQAYHKLWNRRNEVLADAAEKASVAAQWLGGRTYPRDRLNQAWTLVLGGHFHDTMAGTAIPKAYEYAWNDDVIAMNQFAGVLTSATESIASAMNTQTKGVPVIVYNSLQIPREDVVEASVTFPNGAPGMVRVVGPNGENMLAQMSNGKVLFLAKAPAAGYAVYDIQAADSTAGSSVLRVDTRSLDNGRYRVQLDSNGDVSSIFDHKIGRELLSAPMRLAFQYEKPQQWPAWNMDWEDQQKPPRGYVSGPAKVRVVESGPVRVAIEVSRETEGSKFVQTIRLSAANAGGRVEFLNSIDWMIGETALKATFPLSAANSLATYNWDIGTIQRHNDEDRQFEVASHQWVDLTDKSGDYGVTILTDCKNGSDKPDDNTLRLTLIYTPGVRTSYTYMSSNDQGHHEFMFGLAGHAGDWRASETDWQAYRLNQPLMAFQSDKHAGVLGKEFSLLQVSNSRVRVMAVKQAEHSDEIIVRLVEVDGVPQRNVKVSFAGAVTAAREVNGQEQPVGAATLAGGALVASFTPYQPRTFAVKLAPPAIKEAPTLPRPITLKYDRAVASKDGARSSPGFDDKGGAIPAEMLPADLAYAGVHFKLGVSSGANALVSKGQTIALPLGIRRVYILAAADGDQKATFRIGQQPVELTIQDWGGYIGQWDNRNWKERVIELPPSQRPGAPRTRTEPFGEMTGITPGFIKRADLAWFASHHHTAEGANQAYAYSYLFAYAIPVPAGAKSLTLPDNDRIRIMAVTGTREEFEVRPAFPLYF
jgi:alpha-mannosidase